MNDVELLRQCYIIAAQPDARSAASLLRRLRQRNALPTHDDLDRLIAQALPSSPTESMWAPAAVLIRLRHVLALWRDKRNARALGVVRWPLTADLPVARLLDCPAMEDTCRIISIAQEALTELDEHNEPGPYSWACYCWGQELLDLPDGRSEALAKMEKAQEVLARDDTWVHHVLYGRVLEAAARLHGMAVGRSRKNELEIALKQIELASSKLAISDTTKGQTINLTLHGNIYLQRISGERPQNIESAIALYQEGLAVAYAGGLKEMVRDLHHNLSIAYRRRLLGSHHGNLFMARDHNQLGLCLCEPNSRPWARAHAQNAVILGEMKNADSLKHLEDAITSASLANEWLTGASSHTAWARNRMILGNLYCDRLAGSHADNLLMASQIYESILAIDDWDDNPEIWSSVKNNLGTVYEELLAITGASRYYRLAKELYTDALGVFSARAIPAESKRTATNLGHMAFALGKWDEAMEAYDQALAAVEALYQTSATDTGRRTELEGLGLLVERAAYCLLQSPSPKLTRAIEVLEQGRARIIGDMIARERANLASLPTSCQEQYTAACGRVRELEAQCRSLLDPSAAQEDRIMWGSVQSNLYLQASRDLTNERESLDSIISTLRTSYPAFIPHRRGLAAIMDVAASNGPLVYLFTCRDVTTALIMARDGSIRYRRISFSESDLEPIYSKVSDFGHRRLGPDGSLLAPKVLDEQCRELSHLLVGPLLRLLDELALSNATIIPMGRLGLLPLQAAAHLAAEGEPINLAFAPSAESIGANQEQSQCTHDVPPTLIGFADSRPITQPLPLSRVELRDIASLFPQDAALCYEGFWVKLARIRSLADSSRGDNGARALWHFACHGKFEPSREYNSGISIHSGRLTLAHLLESRLVDGAALVTLSACQSGLAEDKDIPDELLGVVSGFMASGAESAIASLWSVDDLSTALLMSRFYRELIKERRTIAAALAAAQDWLRLLTADEARRILETWKSTDALSDGTRSQHSVPTINRSIRQMIRLRKTGRLPFESVYYWGAFQAYGQAHMEV